ncbi:hypothetical protein YERSI8AC_70063 [Enterobacterales bacterium 8AC]|nr:hypothetical protein YERSI8AC_70063 [Enterobacterales bacterium 8AC]
MPNLTISVPFSNSIVYIVKHHGKPYVPMKPIVEGMGMTWQRQCKKLKGRFSSQLKELTIQPTDDDQPTPFLCLSLSNLADWMQTIYPKKVKPEIRETVIQYQEGCCDILNEHWSKGQATNPHKAKKITVGKITPNQQEAIKQLVIARAMVLKEDHQTKTINTLLAALESHFGCSYKEIDEYRFTEALSLAARVPLEGEFLGKQEDLPAQPATPQFDARGVIVMHMKGAEVTYTEYHKGPVIVGDLNMFESYVNKFGGVVLWNDASKREFAREYAIARL